MLHTSKSLINASWKEMNSQVEKGERRERQLSGAQQGNTSPVCRGFLRRNQKRKKKKWCKDRNFWTTTGTSLALPIFSSLSLTSRDNQPGSKLCLVSAQPQQSSHMSWSKQMRTLEQIWPSHRPPFLLLLLKGECQPQGTGSFASHGFSVYDTERDVYICKKKREKERCAYLNTSRN